MLGDRLGDMLGDMVVVMLEGLPTRSFERSSGTIESAEHVYGEQLYPNGRSTSTP
jgi:hypothetical protein